MSLATTILLATFATSTPVSVGPGTKTTLRYKAAPAQGDLIRDGKHPLVLLLPDAGKRAKVFRDLAERLHRGGFAVAAINYPKKGAADQAWKAARAARDWALAQPAVDPERIFIVGAEFGAAVAIDTAGREPAGVAGLVLLSPRLNPEGLAVLPMLSKLQPVPVLMTADITDRNDLNTLRTVLKLRFTDVRRILRAKLGRGSAQLSNSPSLADQLVITTRTWAEKNCDRTRQKKADTLDEGCTK